MNNIPENIEEYKKWLKKEHNINITERTKTYYESVANKIKLDFSKSDIWRKLSDEENLKEFNNDYLFETGYPLFTSNLKPELQVKSFKSFLLKTFRRNIIQNKYFPKKPEGGWIISENWFTKIGDIVRTLFIVKYLDGISFLIKKIKTICETQGLEFRDYLEAREEGYYAAHLYIKKEFEIPKEDWDTKIIKCSVEIQITTQLQEVIRTLLHKYYDANRRRLKKPIDVKWQWNYASDEFTANYLGHILHYVEGMIMEIREKQKEVIK
ncbi:MAG: hypothetical protein ACFFCM_05540 [Promethearchaeota archaeon]